MPPLDHWNEPLLQGSIGGSRGGPGGTCPLDHTGLCLCYVGSKSDKKNADVHTAKVYYSIR